MQDLALQCECGQVRGVVEKVKPASGNRLTCYCSDCQAFAHHVRPKGGVLNAQGGTEIFQVSPAENSSWPGKSGLCAFNG